MLWTGLERVRDLVEVSLPPAAGLTQGLFLLPTPLSSTAGQCATAPCCCVSRRGFTWAESMYGGPTRGWWAGIPFPLGSESPLGTPTPTSARVSLSILLPGLGAEPCSLHILIRAFTFFPDLWGAPPARSEPPPDPASLFT